MQIAPKKRQCLPVFKHVVIFSEPHQNEVKLFNRKGVILLFYLKKYTPMKRLYLPFLMALFFFASCRKDNMSGSNTGNNGRKMDTLQGSITQSLTLDPNKNYYLKGQVYVKNNATLTIPAGITVYAQVNAAASAKSVLVITQGSKLYVNGTIDKQVVFTSAATK